MDRSTRGRIATGQHPRSLRRSSRPRSRASRSGSRGGRRYSERTRVSSVHLDDDGPAGAFSVGVMVLAGDDGAESIVGPAGGRAEAVARVEVALAVGGRAAEGDPALRAD